ncbi:c-type cytochrome [Fulvivirga sedimenti]|uniref:Cytochrome c n=1 Tax=Fulvivirga sedimenti TaxID=2879465 RepID=A0A9X1HNR3_9BACT|nr:cytochrome c [Fulvivirga sedimenti]MCA6074395.1 cytochrome c [Fulvivirga sedimenti]
MKKHWIIVLLIMGLVAQSCGSKTDKDDVPQSLSTPNKDNTSSASVKASEQIDLSNKGVGPVESVVINAEIDMDLAAEGEKIYNQMCTACHKIGQTFIGPPPNGILDRRSPEWVMNMILAPELMVQEDPLARALLAEFNGSPMANQNLTEEQARAVLEYFRTLN